MCFVTYVTLRNLNAIGWQLHLEDNGVLPMQQINYVTFAWACSVFTLTVRNLSSWRRFVSWKRLFKLGCLFCAGFSTLVWCWVNQFADRAVVLAWAKGIVWLYSSLRKLKSRKGDFSFMQENDVVNIVLHDEHSIALNTPCRKRGDKLRKPSVSTFTRSATEVAWCGRTVNDCKNSYTASLTFCLLWLHFKNFMHLS